MRPEADTPAGAADPALWHVAGKSGALLASLLLPGPPPEERSEFHSMLPPSISPVFSDHLELEVVDAGDHERG